MKCHHPQLWLCHVTCTGETGILTDLCDERDRAGGGHGERLRHTNCMKVRSDKYLWEGNWSLFLISDGMDLLQLDSFMALFHYMVMALLYSTLLAFGIGYFSRGCFPLEDSTASVLLVVIVTLRETAVRSSSTWPRNAQSGRERRRRERQWKISATGVLYSRYVAVCHSKETIFVFRRDWRQQDKTLPKNTEEFGKSYIRAQTMRWPWLLKGDARG